jgi:hypothetical protein
MLVDEVNSRARTEIAQGTRIHWPVFVNVGEPTTESNFARMHELYPDERRRQPFPQDGEGCGQTGASPRPKRNRG